jgi:DNA topoisomerase-1
VGLHALVNDHLDQIDPREVNSIPIGDDIVVRVGRYGPYLQRGEDTASLPEDLPPDELNLEKAVELLEAPSGDRALGEDPESGLPVLLRTGRYGPYVQLGEAVEGGEKPATASLFKSMDPEHVLLQEALKLLSLPRVVGTDPSDGQEILALNGRYGPYIKKGSDTRSLEREEQLFELSLDEALGLLAQPKTRTRGATTLKEFGDDPSTGAPMVLKRGRYGPYITDGTTNASLPRGEDPDEITPERAAELLAEKRAKGPTRKKTTRKKSTGKKSTRKKTATKKTTGKKTTKKKKA